MPRPCDLCAATDFRVWDTKNGIDVIVCNACGMGRSEVPEDYEAVMAEYYDGSYYAKMGYDRDEQAWVRRARRWVGHLGELRRPPGNLLDIGCSTGNCLQAATDLGWKAYGTDISAHALARSQERGFEVFASFHPDEFPDWLPLLDAATASHVLEHLPDPVGYLRALRERMKPGGVMYAQLPNFAKILRQGPSVPYAAPPEHAQFFTFETAQRTFEKAGWRVVPHPKVRPHFIGRRLWLWVPELVYEFPRQAARGFLTVTGRLDCMHIFARVD
jgi:2-polyprenyl-3-methyl-5-hydroxy-6-metoxy-1,4-benzoquinol methylase